MAIFAAGNIHKSAARPNLAPPVLAVHSVRVRSSARILAERDGFWKFPDPVLCKTLFENRVDVPGCGNLRLESAALKAPAPESRWRSTRD
jgi:hypothetical protein